MATPALMRDLQELQANINSFSNGEARIIDFDDKLPSLKVELCPKDGFHKGGKFIFQVFPSNSYPYGHQKVIFLTRILHPAVDGENIGVQGNYGLTLEEIVKDVYHQIKNPKFDAVSNPLFYDDLCVSDQNALRAKFAKDVRMSLKVDEILEQMNALGMVKPSGDL